jgi:serine/threonine protein kinase
MGPSLYERFRYYHKPSHREKLEAMRIVYALDIAKGMYYLEKKKIIHRDLRPRNILLTPLERKKSKAGGLSNPQLLAGGSSSGIPPSPSIDDEITIEQHAKVADFGKGNNIVTIIAIRHSDPAILLFISKAFRGTLTHTAT